MPMLPFYTRFRELAFEEMRTIFVFGHASLPAGPYGLLEFYCDEAGCDCRRVFIHVLRPETGDRVWASINYGWEEPAFYRKWASNDSMSEEMSGATLDPMNPQSEHSGALLRLVRDSALSDPAFVQRLGRHYQLFKETPVQPTRTNRRGNKRSAGV